jgi:hypothetical protein
VASSNSLYINATALAELTAGRVPKWTSEVLTSASVFPSSIAGGVDMEESVRCLWRVLPRGLPSARVAYVTPGVLDAASTYRVTVGGVNCDYSGSATLATVLAGIAAAINSAASATVTASVVDLSGDGTNDSVKLVGVANADWSFAASIVSGTGTWSLKKADASSCNVRLWALPEGYDPDTTPPTWALIANFPVAVTFRGMVDEIKSAGISRLYAEVTDIAGHGSDGSGITYMVETNIGPCVRETVDR